MGRFLKDNHNATFERYLFML